MWTSEADVDPVCTWLFFTVNSSIGCSSQKPRRLLSDLCQVHLHLSSQYARIHKLVSVSTAIIPIQVLFLPVKKPHEWPPCFQVRLFWSILHSFARVNFQKCRAYHVIPWLRTFLYLRMKYNFLLQPIGLYMVQLLYTSKNSSAFYSLFIILQPWMGDPTCV